MVKCCCYCCCYYDKGDGFRELFVGFGNVEVNVCMLRVVDWEKGSIVMGFRGNCGREIGDREYREKGLLSFICILDFYVE